MSATRKSLIAAAAIAVLSMGAVACTQAEQNEAEADAARRCGVHLLQGYLYGKPCVNTYQSAAL